MLYNYRPKIIIIILHKLPICNTEITMSKYLKPCKNYKVKSADVLVLMWTVTGVMGTCLECEHFSLQVPHNFSQRSWSA